MGLKAVIGNRQGAFLVEVLVGVAITITMVMVTLSALQQQNHATNYIEDRMARMNLERELSNYFNDAAICLNSLQGLPVPSTPTDFILKDNAGEVILDAKSDTKNHYEKLRITSLQLKNRSISPTNLNGLVDIVATVESKRQVSGPKGPFEVKHSVFVYTTGGSITGCTATTSGQVKSFGPYNGKQNLGKFQACWITKMGNAEDSHYCSLIYDEATGTWIYQQYKSGCIASCV